MLNFHLFTSFFGKSSSPSFGTCGPSGSEPTYAKFYAYFWPILTTITVSLLPGVLMLFFLVGIFIEIRKSQRNVAPQHSSLSNSRETRRNHFIQQQMLIMMVMTVLLFLVTTLPEAMFRFLSGTVKISFSFSFSLFLTSLVSMISRLNYSLNFYLHCLTSKLYRREFFSFFNYRIQQTQHTREQINLSVNLPHTFKWNLFLFVVCFCQIKSRCRFNNFGISFDNAWRKIREWSTSINLMWSSNRIPNEILFSNYN